MTVGDWPDVAARVVAEARTFLGTPFYHTGRAPGVGLDCVGVALVAAWRAGLTQWDDRNYSRQIDPDHLRRCIEHLCDPVDGPPDAGDVLLFAVGGVAQHVGLYTGAGTFVHAYETAGRVIEHRLDGAWARRLVGVYRWRR